MYIKRDYDASWREPMWQRVERELGGDSRARDIVDAFRELYSMYTDDLIEWYANLYDPYIGGYYCTTSGKQNEGYLPDIESTRQALGFISASGLVDHLGGDWRYAIPDEMKEKIAIFAKRMQEPNGYFYNLLKTVEEIDQSLNKRGRDLTWCTGFLRDFGKSPTYDTPNGMKGDGIDAYGNPVSNIPTPQPTPGAPVRHAAAVNYPAYLENRETFLDYLNSEIDIVGKSYHASSQLNGTYKEIKARDEALRQMGCYYSLCDTLIEWLNERINPVTGYWSSLPTFAGTNGFFKVIVIYTEWGYPYPQPLKAVQSVLDGILGNEPSTHNICEIYNLRSALILAKANVKTCHKGEQGDRILALIEDTMMNRGADAIRNTYKKQSAYQKPDGAFAHRVEGSEYMHMGRIPTGLGIDEGDVDAIAKASTGITQNVFAAYGIKPVPIYHEREWKIYKSILDKAQPVYKPGTKTYR